MQYSIVNGKRRVNVYPGVFAARFNPHWMELDHAAVRSTMINGLRGYFRAAGKKVAVIGLSGGLDSSVAAQMSTEALGRKNVIGVSMPYREGGSLENSIDWQYAHLLAKELKIQFIVRDITTATDAAANEGLINVGNSDLSKAEINRLGNIKARQRMIMLYDLAAKYNGLVVGTGNKSEIIVGYTTIYGDNACAVNPLGDIYKTQEFRFAEFIGIPEYIRTRVPTAGLWVGQTDEGEMGFLYRELDPLSFLLFDQGLPSEKVVEFGFTRRFIKRVIGMHNGNLFKSKMPPIISLPHPEVKVEG